MKRKYKTCPTCLKQKDPRSFENTDECRSCRKARRAIKFDRNQDLLKWGVAK